MKGLTARRRVRKMAVLLGVLLALAAPVGAADPPFWGFALDGSPITGARLAELEGTTGLSPRMVVFFLQWPSPGEGGVFPEESLEAIAARGALPCLTWEPMFIREGAETAIAAESILAGRYDGYVREFALRARAWGKPFVIRFAHEMNLSRYHWGTDPEGYGPASPELYRRMFRHVVDIFRSSGATNVLWAFCPNAESVPNPSSGSLAAWNRPEAYWPGDDWVDILGMDGYNWGRTKVVERDGWESRWQSFREIFGPLRRALRELAPAKPIVVFETASVAAGGVREDWLREALAEATDWGIRGVCWFYADKEEDWRLDAAGVAIVRRGTSAASPRLGTAKGEK